MNEEKGKSIEVKNVTNKGVSDPLSPFVGDGAFAIVFKKIQRLTTAVYVLTGFFEDREPLKWKLRTLGQELLSVSIPLKDIESSHESRILLRARNIALEILALLLVARDAGLISEMNHVIISREFTNIIEALSLSEDTFDVSKGVLIRSDFFKVEGGETRKNIERREEQKTIETKQNETPILKDTLYDRAVASSRRELLDLDTFSNRPRSDISFKGQDLQEAGENKKPVQKNLKEFGAVAVKKNSRQSIIINLLKRKKEIMIKDVSPLVEGCSEKTIQRELLAMVKAGILKKSGEKRWSRYSLV